MARRARRYVVTNRVFSVRLPGGAWEVKTVAHAAADFAQERRYWNGRGYETRVETEQAETAYKSVDAVPI